MCLSECEYVCVCVSEGMCVVYLSVCVVCLSVCARVSVCLCASVSV